jgi:RHS repeat-associated protein
LIKGTDGLARVVQEDEYYSFGLRKQAGYNFSNDNRYLYNGKEIQTDLENPYDYGARFSDPVIARWSAMDPHAENYQNSTPYNYVANNPMLLTDTNGMDWFYHSADGKKDPTWIWHDGNTYDTGVKDDNGNNVVLQGQQAVVVFDGSVAEKLGTKSKGDVGYDDKHGNGYLDGHGAVTANVTVYGPGGADDVSHYTGYSMSSDPAKYGVVADGDYNVNYRDPGKSGALHSNWAVNNTEAVPNYWSNPLNPGQIDENGHYYSTGIYIHTSNQSGYAGTTSNPRRPITAGCLLISPKDWKNFNNQLQGVSNFLLQIHRSTGIPYRNSQMAPAYNYLNSNPFKF